LNRQVIKSDYATLLLPQIELEIPAQRGEVTTIEGILSTSAKNLAIMQVERMQSDAVVGTKVADTITKLSALTMAEGLPFTLIVRYVVVSLHSRAY
jgi:zinc finger protein